MSQLVFIIGCQRSGTTMLAALLNGSDRCVTAPESQFKFRLLNDDEFDSVELDKLRRDFRFLLWKQKVEYLEGKPLKNSEVFTQLIKERLGKKSDYIFIDHTPENVEYVPELIKTYPNAKFLHIIRDGRAVYRSLKNVTWGPKDPILAARWWHKKVAWGLASSQIIPPKQLMTVKYEDILSQPAQTLSRICEWLNIKYSENLLKGNNDFLPDYTRDQHRLVGQSVQSENKDRWKDELSEEDVFFFQRETGKFLQNLGYPLFTENYQQGLFSALKVRLVGYKKARAGRKKHDNRKKQYSRE